LCANNLSANNLSVNNSCAYKTSELKTMANAIDAQRFTTSTVGTGIPYNASPLTIREELKFYDSLYSRSNCHAGLL